MCVRSFPLLRAAHLCFGYVKEQGRDVGEEEGVNWLRHLVLRWGARNLSLVCPRCQHPASSPTFRRGRYMLGDEKLVCDACGQASVVTFWRFEGLSSRCDGAEASRREPLPNSRH
jgi:hypothetical protein